MPSLKAHLRNQSAPTSLCCTRSCQAQTHIPSMQGCSSRLGQRSEDTSTQPAPCAWSGPNSVISETAAQPPMSNPSAATPEFPVAVATPRPPEQSNCRIPPSPPVKGSLSLENHL